MILEYQPVEDYVEQLFDVLGAEIASKLLVQVPPDQLNWIGLGSVGRQKMQPDTMAQSLQKLAYLQFGR